MNLDDLIDKTLLITKARGYPENTWKFMFRNGRFSSLRKFFSDRGREDFDVALAKEYIVEIQTAYKAGRFSYSRAAHLKKVAAWFIEIYETGKLQSKPQRKSTIVINEYFENILACYSASKEGVLSSTNIRRKKSDIRKMLYFFQSEKGYQDFSQVSLKDVQDFIFFVHQSGRKRLDTLVCSGRFFLSYLKEVDIIANDLTQALYLPAQKARIILAGFSHEEVDRILSQPDRNMSIGKRDYAILLLGRNTGLRIGDIIKIELTDIDWKRDEISVTQRKTGNHFVLPLEPDTEHAIIDYIRNARPRCNLPYIFIRHNAPYDALSQQSVTIIFSRYRTAAGVPHSTGDGKTFHGLRRSIASWMLEADIPLTTISQVLGHRQISSANQYLSIDERNLQKCALSLNGIEVGKEGLM